MKKIRITIVHELDVPDDSEIVTQGNDKILKLANGILIQPDIEYMRAVKPPAGPTLFQDMDEATEEMIYDGLSYEKIDIAEL